MEQFELNEPPKSWARHILGTITVISIVLLPRETVEAYGEPWGSELYEIAWLGFFFWLLWSFAAKVELEGKIEWYENEAMPSQRVYIKSLEDQIKSREVETVSRGTGMVLAKKIIKLEKENNSLKAEIKELKPHK